MERGKISSCTFFLFFFFSLLLTNFCTSIQATTQDPVIMRQILPVYAVMENIDLLNSSRCRTEIEEFRNAVDKRIIWGLRAMDTSGVPPKGFLHGHNFWLGDRKSCDILSQNITLPFSEKTRKNNSIYRNPNEEFPPFQFRFFLGRMWHNSTMQYHIGTEKENLITLGLCLPASCSKRDVATMLDKVFRDETLLIGKLFSIGFRLIEVTDLVDDHQWLLSAKIVSIIGFLLLLVATATGATLYDFFVHRRAKERSKKEFLTFENNNTNELKNEAEGKCNTDHEEPVLAESRQQSPIFQYLLCFSLFSNIQQIFHREKGEDNTRVFHGLKFFGMVWIITAHSVFYSLHTISNKIVLFTITDTVPAQILSNATYSVDTYFFISGFLLTHIFLKDREKDKRIPPVTVRVTQLIQMLVKRYVRITPAYFIVIMIVILNFSWHDRVSLILPLEEPSTKCSKYWWTNILYINNFYNWDELCLTWSWYLPNDMQFFIFGGFVLILSVTHYNIAMGLCGVTLLSSIGSSLYVAYTLDYHTALDEQYRTLSYLYLRPWLRVSPYLIGMMTCQLLSKWNYQLHLSKKSFVVGSILAILCNCVILFSTAIRGMSLSLSVLYVGFGRTGWAMGIAWLIIACTTNHAGKSTKFLSLDIFVPLSRLTYCAYLINPLIILSLHSLRVYPFTADEIMVGAMSVTIIISTFIVSILLSAIAEVPFILLLRLHNNAQRRKK
ncbi:nose resistant to fluoxetine protein 6-like isoform X1 [Bombus pascuorum]|uniref:nose resistant to fluoxetine protein 6-like isoform X1 n=1 Tax=Bombus pascuorum TaxID=65598 RepID=UPI00298E73B7|nr:nose resistant to fluoxetine protein 6-like isoform X1 [Bombus pascuorum]